MLERVVGVLRGEAEETAHGESLEEAVLHDYSTSKQGIVPLDKRRPIWHFAAIFFTLEAGFAYIFLGFTLNEAGFTLPAAGKTGTTNDSVDTWFNGFHPSLVAIVWIGFDQPKSLGDRETGGDAAIKQSVAETGVDYLSIGALTHSAPSMDLALDFD